MLNRDLSTILTPATIIALGLVSFFWLRSNNSSPERTQVTPKPPVVETILFEPSGARFEIQVGGNVVPSREVTISAQVEGAVIAKSDNLESGRYVTHATSLLQIDPASYELEVQTTTSEYRQVEEDLRRVAIEASGNAALVRIAEDKLRLATQELARTKSLFADNAVSETKRDEAQRLELEASDALSMLQNARDLIPIRRRRLEAELKSTDFRRRKAQLSLDRTKVVAPFDGIITTDAVETGDFVQVGDVLLGIQETASIEVECNLRTDDLYWIWNSQQPASAQNSLDDEHSDRAAFEVPPVRATITYRVAGQSFHWQGTLARFGGRGIDRATRTVPCRVVVPNLRRSDTALGPPALMRGMYVTVTLPVEPQTRLWRLPNHALQPNGQIWTLKDSALQIHKVDPVRMFPDGILIRADDGGLKPGDRIIVSPLTTAFDGMQLRSENSTERQR